MGTDYIGSPEPSRAQLASAAAGPLAGLQSVDLLWSVAEVQGAERLQAKERASWGQAT